MDSFYEEAKHQIYVMTVDEYLEHMGNAFKEQNTPYVMVNIDYEAAIQASIDGRTGFFVRTSAVAFGKNLPDIAVCALSDVGNTDHYRIQYSGNIDNDDAQLMQDVLLASSMFSNIVEGTLTPEELSQASPLEEPSEDVSGIELPDDL